GDDDLEKNDRGSARRDGVDVVERAVHGGRGGRSVRDEPDERVRVDPQIPAGWSKWVGRPPACGSELPAQDGAEDRRSDFESAPAVWLGAEETAQSAHAR